MCKKLRRLGLFDFVISRKPLYRVLVVDNDAETLSFCKDILLKAQYDEAWQLAADEDREKAAIRFVPRQMFIGNS